MSVTLSSVSRDRSLAGFLAQQAPSATSSQALGFEQQLASAIRDSLSQAGVTSGRVEVSVVDSPGGSSSGARQILVTITQPTQTGGAVQSSATGGQPLAQVQAAAQSSASGGQAGGAGGATAGSNDPVQVLKDALTAAGLDPTRLSLTESREVVGYPGGSYVNHVITADFGGGLRECYGVELMLRNPQVTVVEIRRALNSLNAV